MTEPTSAQDLFKGRHFDQEIIVLCVSWYLTFKLSSPGDLVQMMASCAASPWPIRPFCGGCSGMSLELRSAGAVMRGRSAIPWWLDQTYIRGV